MKPDMNKKPRTRKLARKRKIGKERKQKINKGRKKKIEELRKSNKDLVDYDLVGDGNVAIVHYTSAETFKWTGPDNERGWKTGDIYKGFARWSDVLVKEDGKWLCIGGHRDRSQSAKGLIKLN